MMLGEIPEEIERWEGFFGIGLLYLFLLERMIVWMGVTFTHVDHICNFEK